MIPIALIHERDPEAAFNGMSKIRALLKQKTATRECFEFLMNCSITNKFKKKSRGNRYNKTIHHHWEDIQVCSQCRFAEGDEISALTLLQVLFCELCIGIETTNMNWTDNEVD